MHEKRAGAAPCWPCLRNVHIYMGPGRAGPPSPRQTQGGRGAPGSDPHSGRPQTCCVKALGDIYNWEAPGSRHRGPTRAGHGVRPRACGRCGRGGRQGRPAAASRETPCWPPNIAPEGGRAPRCSAAGWSPGRAASDTPRPAGRPLTRPQSRSEAPGSALPLPEQPQRRSGQSSLSTFPMIFSSKTGRMAASSRTSSNTTPQSNSSLTFLK